MMAGLEQRADARRGSIDAEVGALPGGRRRRRVAARVVRVAAAAGAAPPALARRAPARAARRVAVGHGAQSISRFTSRSLMLAHVVLLLLCEVGVLVAPVCAGCAARAEQVRTAAAGAARQSGRRAPARRRCGRQTRRWRRRCAPRQPRGSGRPVVDGQRRRRGSALSPCPPAPAPAPAPAAHARAARPRARTRDLSPCPAPRPAPRGVARRRRQRARGRAVRARCGPSTGRRWLLCNARPSRLAEPSILSLHEHLADLCRFTTGAIISAKETRRPRNLNPRGAGRARGARRARHQATSSRPSCGPSKGVFTPLWVRHSAPRAGGLTTTALGQRAVTAGTRAGDAAGGGVLPRQSAP